MSLRQNKIFIPVVGAGLTVFCGLLLWGTTFGGFWVDASDIKPQNIIFVNDQPKLADVGLVNEVTSGVQTQTGPCTPAYMAPGDVPGTPQADIYALGMVLYVMFMGQEPESFPAIATTLVNGASGPEFIRINAAILRACHPESSRRYASAREMADALKEVQATLQKELPVQP